jgi:dTDP-4-amino-4,6-dideoxygalactose transaminase
MGKQMGYRDGQLPVTEDLSARLLRLPFYHEITEDEQTRVVTCIAQYLKPAFGGVRAALGRRS